MLSFLSKHKKAIFIGTVITFLAGIFVGLGGYFFTSSSLGAVADVGGKKIPYQRFTTQVNYILEKLRDGGTDVNESVRKEVKQEIFRDMIVEELLLQQAEKIGIVVPDFEIAVEIQNAPQFKTDGQFNPRLYYQTIWGQFHMSPKEYESWRKKSRLSNKYKQFIFSNIKITPDELKEYYLAKNKNLTNFDKEKEQYMQKLTQEKFYRIANYYLRQLSTRIEIKDYLQQREKGQ